MRAPSFALAILAACVAPARAADHRDAPLIQLDSRADINDVYAFVSPANTSNTVLIMTVNPVAGVLSPDTFTPGVKYEIEIYNDDDLKRDIVFTVKFGKVDGGEQDVKVKVKGTEDKIGGQGRVGQTQDLGDGVQFQAGVYDDPFFVNLPSIADVSTRVITDTSQARDFYEGTNVNAFVVEVPTSLLTRPPETIIAVRGVAKKGGTDSVGRPLVSRLLLPPERRDAFNKVKLVKQDDFRPDIAAVLANFYNPTSAANLADFFVADVLPIDTAQPTAFLNGRTLDDDVVDIMLHLVTNGVVDTDGIDANDVAFPGTFPYLAAPH